MGYCRRRYRDSSARPDGRWNRHQEHLRQAHALPRQALAILRQMYEKRINDCVFSGRDLDGPMSNNTMLKALKEISGDPSLTVHGLRGTFRTWAQEETDFEEEIVEHCMHHITGDDAEKAYKHGQALKKRRVVVQAWADFATKLQAKFIARDQAA